MAPSKIEFRKIYDTDLYIGYFIWENGDEQVIKDDLTGEETIIRADSAEEALIEYLVDEEEEF